MDEKSDEQKESNKLVTEFDGIKKMLAQLDTLQSNIISECDQMEEKLPKNPYHLQNLLRIIQNCQQAVRKSVQKSAIMNVKTMKILQSISSKIAEHEANFEKWTAQDVALLVFLKPKFQS